MKKTMKTCRCGIGLAMLAGLLCVSGCEGGDDGSGSVLPSATTGPAGQSVRIVGIGNGDTVACSQAGADVWAFSVGFSADAIDARYAVQMLVEVDKDASGAPVWGSGRGPYVQGGGATVTAPGGGGVVSGRIGPPASDSVRFNIALRLLDASGHVVAVSQSVKGLRPVLQ